MSKYNTPIDISGIKYVVFFDYGYNGCSIDTFTDVEQATSFYEAMKAEDDHISGAILPVTDGAEIVGVPEGLSQYRKYDRR